MEMKRRAGGERGEGEESRGEGMELGGAFLLQLHSPVH